MAGSAGETMYTTLSNIRADRPHPRRYRHLCKSLGGLKAYGKDTPLRYSRILEICGFSDCLWLLEAVDERTGWILTLANFGFVERFLYILPDARIQNYIKTLHLFIHGETTKDAMLKAYNIAHGAVEAGDGKSALAYSYDNEAWSTSWDIISVAFYYAPDNLSEEEYEQICNNESLAHESILRVLLIQAETEDASIVFGTPPTFTKGIGRTRKI